MKFLSVPIVLTMVAAAASATQEAAAPDSQKPAAATSKEPEASTSRGPAAARQSAKPRASEDTFPAEQLEQIVAPIALYPDKVLAHVLMASTYPIEIVQAARWLRANPGLSGKKLEQALQEQTWDPSVKSLCGFPEVLQRMNQNLDWTQDLGDAFLCQKEAVMDAVQKMRHKALESGSLKSSDEMKVTEEGEETIVIENSDPEVVYVPTYYPSVVYGSWSYPYWYYPPLYYPPPAGHVWFGFTVGVIWGSAIWGDCNWGHGDIDIDIDHHHDFVDRTESSERRQQVKDRIESRPGAEGRPSTSDRAQTRPGTGETRPGSGDRGDTRPGTGDTRPGTGDTRPGSGDRGETRPGTGETRPGSGDRGDTRPGSGDRGDTRPGTRDRATWQHDPSHRKGVGYRDSATARQYGAGPGQTRVPRDQARGYPSTRRRTAASPRPGATPSARQRTAASGANRGTVPSTRQPTTTSRTNRSTTPTTRRSTGQRTSTFTGSRSPGLDRRGSTRGSVSRRSMGSRSRGGGGFRGGGRRR